MKIKMLCVVVAGKAVSDAIDTKTVTWETVMHMLQDQGDGTEPGTMGGVLSLSTKREGFPTQLYAGKVYEVEIREVSA